MADTIIQAVTDYFMDCPLLKDGAFRVDALGETGIEYAVETGSFDPIIKKYVNGSSIRQYQFSFASREYWSMDRIQNIENSGFYEEMAAWVEQQDHSKSFPDLPDGMQPERLEIMSPGYIFDITTKFARYQLPMRLLYYQDAP